MHTLKIHGLEMKFKSSLKQGRSGSIRCRHETAFYQARMRHTVKSKVMPL